MHFFSVKTNLWKNRSFTIKIGKKIINNVICYKYLGVIIDSNLYCTEHVEAIKYKLLRTIGVLYKTRYFLNEKSLNLIFISVFMIYIRYRLLCWSRANKIKIKEINVLINRAIRCIYFKGYNESASKIN